MNEGKLVEVLRKKAATLGADAIILGEMVSDSKPWAVQGAGTGNALDRKMIKATAIKFLVQPLD